jgi:RNA recognition motif-containing protein
VTKPYVGDLPFTATDEAVHALFARHGTVAKVSLIAGRDSGRPRGFAFVEMSDADAARSMQALNATGFDGCSLKLSGEQDRVAAQRHRAGGLRRCRSRPFARWEWARGPRCAAKEEESQWTSK